MKISCFKAYDIRGRVPDQLNDDVAYRVGRAYVDFLGAKKVLVGHDIRLTSASLTNALVNGITDAGADVIHIGQVGTEDLWHEVVRATTHRQQQCWQGERSVGDPPVQGKPGCRRGVFG